MFLYNQEFQRLASFRPVASLPRHISYFNFSKAGFRYDADQGNNATCSECRYYIPIADVNRSLSNAYYHADGCSFVKADDSFELVGWEQSKIDGDFQEGPDNTNLFQRLYSFLDYPFPDERTEPSILAENGFYFVGPCKTIQCYLCGTILQLHEEMSQNFLQYFQCARCCYISETTPFQDENLNDSGRGLFSIPRSQNHSTEFQRLCSFLDGWPEKFLLPPKLLASAGYYYTGFGTIVACYQCEIRRRPEDEGFENFLQNLACSKCIQDNISQGIDNSNHQTNLDLESEESARANDVSTLGGASTGALPVLNQSDDYC